jgi:CubicO group peptidase (beta-lactamase class C family)
MAQPFLSTMLKSSAHQPAVERGDSAQSGHNAGKSRLLSAIAIAVVSVSGSAFSYASGALAQIQQVPQALLSPVESDPIAMGWMQGSPPTPDKIIKFEDGSFGRFPQTRWSFSHYRELFPTARVKRGKGAVSALPLALRDDLDGVTFTPLGGQSAMTWAEAFEAVYGDAVIILHRGRIVFERYKGVMDGDTPHIAFSVSKSFSGTLAEMLIAEGKVDQNALVSRYIPELAQSGFGDATVRQILDMTSGLDYSENYLDPKAQVVQYAWAAGASPRPSGYSGPRNTFDFLKTVAKSGEHGAQFTYRTVNTEVLGVLLARVTNKRLPDLLSERIWSKLGTEHDADFVVDSNGAAVAGGGLNITLRDAARFGEMIRLHGRFNGQQIVPRQAIASIRHGASQADFAKAGYATLPNWSYRSQWWVTHNGDGAFSARGIYGQAIYIDPKAEMVIVRFASNPKAGNASFDPISLPAYQAIADQLMKTPKRTLGIK